MKNIISLIIAALALAFTGCSTPTQQQAAITAEGGNLVATYVLDTQGKAAVVPLQNLAAALPQIPLGKVSAYQLGAINAQLKGIQANIQANLAGGSTAVGTGSLSVKLSDALDQVGSLIALVSNDESALAGGAQTIDQSVASGVLQDVATGITNAISYWQGGQSVTNPPAAP